MGLIRRYQSTIYGNYKSKWLSYGFLAGLGLIVIVILRYAMVFPIYLPVSILDNFILLGLMFAFTYLYRKDNHEKKLTFKESYLLNLGIGVIAAIIYMIFLWFYAQYIDKDFSSRYFDHQFLKYEQLEISETDFTQKIQELKDFATPKNLALRAFIELSVISVLFSMIVSIFMRTEKAPIREKKGR